MIPDSTNGNVTGDENVTGSGDVTTNGDVTGDDGGGDEGSAGESSSGGGGSFSFLTGLLLVAVLLPRRWFQKRSGTLGATIL